MAESLEFREEWVIQIKEWVNNDDENSLPKVCNTLRVAKSLLNEKPEAYIPQCFSLGPLHHWKLEKAYIDSGSMGGYRISNAEAYKGKSAARISHKLRTCGKNFDNIVEMMDQMLPEIACFYDWRPLSGSMKSDYSMNFALMMAVDSSFLLSFLFTLFRFQDLSQPAGSHLSLDGDVIRLCSTLQASIKCDIMKLENQIPLYVLKGVFEKVKEAFTVHKGFQDFNLLLQKTCSEFSPFRRPEIDSDDERERIIKNIDEEPHLMGCMHAFVSPLLQMHAAGEDKRPANRPLLQKLNRFLENLVIWVSRFLTTNPNIERQILKGISVGQLERAGIKVKSFSMAGDQIRVDKYSRTLYLPAITVSDLSTEVFLRNMVALELNEAFRPKSVTHYVTLMGCLIQSPDDVRLLRENDVIYREYCPLTDDVIVNIWNSIRHRSLAGSLLNTSQVNVARALQEVLEKNYRKIYYKDEIRRMILEFRTIWGLIDYFSSWKFIAPLCALLVLAMTAIQTYCTFSAWLVSPGNSH